MTIVQSYGTTSVPMPGADCIPEEYAEDIYDLFEVWAKVSARNRALTTYFDMKNAIKDLGISIPEKLTRLNCAVGWCKKAVESRVVRSRFDGYVFGGETDADLSDLVRRNNLRLLYKSAATSALTHGLSAMTVMRGKYGQPRAKVRAYSANQFACLWDKSLDRIKCGIVLHDVDRDGVASCYVAHFDDAVVTFSKDGNGKWTSDVEDNPMGRPLMEVLVYNRTLDDPLGRTLLTPEIIGIVDKAMRDVLRMEIGAEFFTFPQRYFLGVADDMFAAPPEPGTPVDEDGNPVDENGDPLPTVSSDAMKMKAYIGSILAITKDEDGDIPQVGQFSPAPAENFTRMFENDAQRFSGATHVPLAQLGVLSNTYTSSDALGAANDPLILDVELMNESFAPAMEEIARMMMAVNGGVPLDGLTRDQMNVEAYFADPSMPTIAARADAWTKFGASDQSIVGTDVYYEGFGLPKLTIERLKREKEKAGAISTMNGIAEMLAGGSR